VLAPGIGVKTDRELWERPHAGCSQVPRLGRLRPPVIVAAAVKMGGPNQRKKGKPRSFDPGWGERGMTTLYCMYAISVIQSFPMKTLTVRLPEALVAQIEAESRRRKLSKSDVVRERLTGSENSGRRRPAIVDAIADIIGSVDGLPRDLSSRKKKYLKSTSYGDKRTR
jgi:hypothetical protein